MSERNVTEEEKKAKRKRRERIAGIVLIGLAAAGCLLFHPLMVKHYRSMLTEKGYYQPVSVGDHSLNLLTCGRENGSRRIVSLSGFGCGDTSVSMRKMTAELEKDNQLIFLDRAGYGASDDSKGGMDTQTIVADCRTALKNAGIQAPYTLMAHSLAGVYASYWVSKYPDEIESVILLDSTWLLPENAEDSVTPAVLRQYAMYFSAKTGLTDICPSTFDGTKEEKKLAKALFSMTNDSGALLTEAKREPENIKAALDALSPNDVPKLYIQCGKVFPDEAKANLARYTDRLGSCKTELLDSGHLMYLEKPEACCKIIQDFFDSTAH